MYLKLNNYILCKSVFYTNDNCLIYQNNSIKEKEPKLGVFFGVCDEFGGSVSFKNTDIYKYAKGLV